MDNFRQEYADKLRLELSDKSKEDLKKYAREKGIKLHTKVLSKMLDAIVEISTVREYHGAAYWN